MVCIGFALQMLLRMAYNKTKVLLGEKIIDIDIEIEHNRITTDAIIGKAMFNPRVTKYLEHLSLTKQHTAFTLAQFNILSSADVEGRYVKKYTITKDFALVEQT